MSSTGGHAWEVPVAGFWRSGRKDLDWMKGHLNNLIRPGRRDRLGLNR